MDVVVPQLQHRKKYSIQSWKSQPPTSTILQIPYSLDTVSPFKVPQLGCAVSSLWCLNYTIYSYLFPPFRSFLTLSPLLHESSMTSRTYLLFCPRLNYLPFLLFLIIFTGTFQFYSFVNLGGYNKYSTSTVPSPALSRHWANHASHCTYIQYCLSIQ